MLRTVGTALWSVLYLSVLSAIILSPTLVAWWLLKRVLVGKWPMWVKVGTTLNGLILFAVVWTLIGVSLIYDWTGACLPPAHMAVLRGDGGFSRHCVLLDL